MAATDNADQRTPFSNYGSPDVFVSAPGVDILSTYPAALPPTDCAAGDPVGYCRLDGTSMAAPFVSGVAALIVSLHPEASPSAVRQMLATSSDKVGPLPYGTDPYGTCAGCTWQQDYGYGRVNLVRALSTAVPPPPLLPPPPPRPPLPLAPARCVVPRTVGKSLTMARRKLVASHCRVGRVGYRYSRLKRGLVYWQSRTAGAKVPSRTKIRLLVSLGRR